MRVFLIFLITAFIVGGTSIGRPVRSRPMLLLLGCAVVGASYYSYRVVR